VCSQPSCTGPARPGHRLLEVSGRDLWSPDQHLTVLGDAHLRARQRGADRADTIGAGTVEGDEGRLGEAVGVVKFDPQLTEIQQHVLASHGGADCKLSSAAQPHLGQEAPPQQRAERVPQETGAKPR
jgi:hypothetical protein